jgi:hypothetical protein
MSKTATNQLAALIAKLQAQRQQHEDAIAAIDATFEQFGISAAPAKKRPGRPRKAGKRTKAKKASKVAKKVIKNVRKAKRKVRHQFATTAEQSILGLVKATGSKGVPGAQIVKHLKAEGRGVAGAYVTIGKLVTEKKLKKEKIKGGRGSRYSAV